MVFFSFLIRRSLPASGVRTVYRRTAGPMVPCFGSEPSWTSAPASPSPVCSISERKSRGLLVTRPHEDGVTRTGDGSRERPGWWLAIPGSTIPSSRHLELRDRPIHPVPVPHLLWPKHRRIGGDRGSRVCVSALELIGEVAEYRAQPGTSSGCAASGSMPRGAFTRGHRRSSPSPRAAPAGP